MTKTQRNSSLDAKTLDEKYVILESKMKYYEGIEDAAVDSMGPMLLDFLGDLRQNPERYLMSENESVAALATARMLVREVERDIIKTVAKSKIEDDSVTQSMNLTLDEQSRKSSVGFGVSGTKQIC
jgi:cob(I)alamin adenosyltransferase